MSVPRQRHSGSRISPVAQKIQAFIPTPYNSALVNNWQQTYPTSDLQSVPSIKFDQNISSKQQCCVLLLGVPDRPVRHARRAALADHGTAHPVRAQPHHASELRLDRYPAVARPCRSRLHHVPESGRGLSSVLAYDAPAQLGLAWAESRTISREPPRHRIPAPYRSDHGRLWHVAEHGSGQRQQVRHR